MYILRVYIYIYTYVFTFNVILKKKNNNNCCCTSISNSRSNSSSSRCNETVDSKIIKNYTYAYVLAIIQRLYSEHMHSYIYL